MILWGDGGQCHGVKMTIATFGALPTELLEQSARRRSSARNLVTARSRRLAEEGTESTPPNTDGRRRRARG